MTSRDCTRTGSGPHCNARTSSGSRVDGRLRPRRRRTTRVHAVRGERGGARAVDRASSPCSSVRREPDARATDRLFPRAYLDPTEDTAEREWQSLVHDDLVRNKLAAFDGVADRLAGATAGNATASCASRSRPSRRASCSLAVNDARLALGTALGVTRTRRAVDARRLAARPHRRAAHELQLAELPEVTDDDGEQPPDALAD